MNKGYVYILSNPSMPSLVLLGKTGGRVSDRIANFNSMDIPMPFELEAKVFVPDVDLLANRFDRCFSHVRVSPCRDFYVCDAQTAVMNLALRYTLELFTREQILSARAEFASELRASRIETKKIVARLCGSAG